MMHKLLPAMLLGALLGATACAPEPFGAASPGVPAAAAAQPAQQGVGSSQEDAYVTQRGGGSAPMQGGRITGMTGQYVGVTRAGPGVGIRNPRITSVQQEGGGNVTVQRAPSTGTVGSRARITGTRTDGTVDRGANVGAPSTQGPIVTNPRN